MAIVEMRKLSICANRKNRKDLLETLQSMGCMEMSTSFTEDEDLQTMDTKAQQAQFEKNAQMFDRALEVLDTYAPEKKGFALFEGKELVEKASLKEVVKNQHHYVKEAQKILRYEKEIQECRGTIQKEQVKIESLAPWMNLDIPMNFKGTKKTDVLIGTMPGALSEAEVFAAATEGLEGDPPVSAQVISAANDVTCVAVVCLKKCTETVEGSLRSQGFARPVQVLRRKPSEAVKASQENIAKQEARIEELSKQLAEAGKERTKLKIAADYFRTRAEKYELLGKIPQTENAFFLEGWVPAPQADAVARTLTEKYDALVETEEVSADEIPPTLLKNNRFSESAEGVLESYGLPTKGHVDPTFVMSIFYVFFFGMMFSDLGYGLMMAIACGIVVLKFRDKLSAGMFKMIKLFFWCGVSTAFWGIMYGGFFGDAIDVVAKTFFGYTGETPIMKPLWFEPMAQPMKLLVWCMFFGVIHLYAGLAIKGWEYLKNKDIVGLISDVVSWYLFLTGLILMLLPSKLFASIAGDAFDFSGLAAWGNVATAITLIGLVIILVMQERSTKNWILRILLGAYDIYGVTGWLSDVLSYSRLLALGMATGVIANVINMMASMFGGGVVGAILFIIVFILGHTLNFGINALGAYVHTNRLQFVEFFGKFYEGGGKPFKAFKNEDKYIELKEEKVS